MSDEGGAGGLIRDKDIQQHRPWNNPDKSIKNFINHKWSFSLSEFSSLRENRKLLFLLDVVTNGVKRGSRCTKDRTPKKKKKKKITVKVIKRVHYAKRAASSSVTMCLDS